MLAVVEDSMTQEIPNLEVSSHHHKGHLPLTAG